jgi:uncharacterized protein with GYD domain
MLPLPFAGTIAAGPGSAARTEPTSQERRKAMATFITLINLTDQGARNIKDSPKRFEAYKAQAEKLGLTIKSVYWTTGKYDMILTIEGSEEAAMTSLLKTITQGNVRSQTLRAFTSDEMKGFVGKLP